MKLDIKADQNNFFNKSTADFTKVTKSEIKGRKPDYISYCRVYEVEELDLSQTENLHFVGKTPGGDFIYENRARISSKYWYTSEGVFRESDHWNRVAGCYWGLRNKKGSAIFSSKKQMAFAKWDDFKFLTPYTSE